MPATFALLLVLAQTTRPKDKITLPPKELRANGFYTKCVYFRGIPIIGSQEVDDRAFRQIVKTFGKMLARVPDAPFQSMIKAGNHYCIIGKNQGQTDLPEYADLRNDPNTDWNKRARGLGGDITSGGEENILELPEDRYKGESIYIHEFAHTLASLGFAPTDPTFMTELREAYQYAMSHDLWKNTYSATNEHEYWAEGVQAYFDCCRRSIPSNGVHNEICNRTGLKNYDTRLFNLVDRKFGGNPWRYEGKYNTTHIRN